MTPEALTEAGEQLFPGLAWSQPNDFARALDVPHSTLYQWKQGRRKMPAVAIGFVQHLLECTMSKSAETITYSGPDTD